MNHVVLRGTILLPLCLNQIQLCTSIHGKRVGIKGMITKLGLHFLKMFSEVYSEPGQT